MDCSPYLSRHTHINIHSLHLSSRDRVGEMVLVRQQQVKIQVGGAKGMNEESMGQHE